MEQADCHPPKHTLSEILTRRSNSLARHMEKARTLPPESGRDIVTACTEEMASIEYHLRIVQQAESAVRVDNLFETIRGIAQEYNERILNGGHREGL